MTQTRLTNRFMISTPIIQAPMAGGITTPHLVAAVSNAGGLGMIGAGYLTPEALQKEILEVKALTDKPFGVNLFIPKEPVIDQQAIQHAEELFAPFRKALSLPDNSLKYKYTNTYEEQFEVICKENIPICSFTFGIPTEEQIQRLKQNNTLIIGTATTVKEAIHNEKSGMDAVVVQGYEAGGHRGTYLSENGGNIGLMSLLPQVADQVSIPIIAAGGIMDGRGVKAALILGAEAVQLGTAFLTTLESGANSLYKQAVLKASEDDTVLTRAFSGKYARGIKNTFIKDMADVEKNLPEFPITNSLTGEIRKASLAKGSTEYMSLWSGQSPTLAREESVEQLMKRIIDHVRVL